MWAAMVSLGRSGYRRYAGEILEASARMIEAVRSHPELEVMGDPTFLFSFTSPAFDVYHVNDFLRSRSWRLNGQQYPNALDMVVTRPRPAPGRSRPGPRTWTPQSTTPGSTPVRSRAPGPYTAASTPGRPTVPMLSSKR